MSSWPNLAELIAAPDETTAVGLVGVPLGAGSVTPGGCDRAPELLRATLKRIATYDVETGREIATRIADHGDLEISGMSIEDASTPIRNAIAASALQRPLTLVAGGNNAVTRPAVHALGLPLERVGLVTLDAHFDMRELGPGLSNGNPVRALLGDGLPGRNIAQLGLAPFANSRAMHEDALAAGNLVVTIGEIGSGGIARAVERALGWLGHVEAIVVDCDIDVIDRGQLPGAPGARPGGMAVHDFFAAVRQLAAEPRVRIVDLVEWDPMLDPSDLSALTAARWLAECLAGFETR
ncbi:arginase family protein [Sphingomonas ginkgonis]|nr:arginase family protein [Sphingomonas ginkgonis]